MPWHLVAGRRSGAKTGPAARAFQCRSRSSGEQRRALTLLEMLSVVILVGLVAALGVPALARSVAHDPLAAAQQELSAVEGQVRALAYGHGLRVEIDGDGLRAYPLRNSGDASGTPLVVWRTPADTQTTWSRLGVLVTTLQYDRAGRSEDVTVEFRQGERLAGWELAGLSGEWNRQRTAAP